MAIEFLRLEGVTLFFPRAAEELSYSPVMVNKPMRAVEDLLACGAGALWRIPPQRSRFQGLAKIHFVVAAIGVLGRGLLRYIFSLASE